MIRQFLYSQWPVSWWQSSTVSALHLISRHHPLSLCPQTRAYSLLAWSFRSQLSIHHPNNSRPSRCPNLWKLARTVSTKIMGMSQIVWAQRKYCRSSLGLLCSCSLSWLYVCSTCIAKLVTTATRKRRCCRLLSWQKNSYWSKFTTKCTAKHSTEEHWISNYFTKLIYYIFLKLKG